MVRRRLEKYNIEKLSPVNEIINNPIEEKLETEVNIEKEEEKEQDENICVLCETELLDTDKKADYECGCHKVHIRCCFRAAYYNLRNFGSFSCGTCSAVLFDDTSDYDIDDNLTPDLDNIDNLSILKKSKEFNDDLEKVKTKNKALRAAQAQFKKKLSEEYTKYNNIVKISILNIKLAKTDSIKSIKNTEEYKAIMKASSSTRYLTTRFRTRYNLNWREARLLNIMRSFSYLYSATNLIRRKFRLRI
jgi:peptide methionine sulfoxide reductase MsrB